MRALTCVWIMILLLGVPGVSGAQSDLPDDAILALDWRPDGAHIALGRQDGTVEIIDAETGESAVLPDSGEQPTLAIAWSPDGSQLASGSGDHLVRIWDVATGELQFALEGHRTPVDTVAWNPYPSGPELASGSATSDGVYIWNPTTGEELRVVPISGPRAIAWDASGLSLVAAQETATIIARDTVPGESFGAMLFVLAGHTDVVTSVDWNPITTQIASGSQDHTVRTWTNFALITTFEGHTDAVTQVAWHPDGLLLASTSLDGTLRVWDIVTWQAVDVVQADGALYALDWNPDGTQIAYGGADGALHFHDVAG